ncbi:MAG: (Fe-S)-binding protein [Nitrospirae bacterium]|nr:(Fe-S)-binding protein [Nitrospirota bacterium]MBI3352508.1 (Fe-S)-binding protein [Nitrospirota bacterium]
MPLSNLKHLIEEYETCIRCGACLAVCPTFDAELIESYGPRGRVQLAGRFILNQMEVTPGFTDKMTSCIDCKACVAACPRGVELDTLFNAAKEKVAFFKGMGFFNRWIATGVHWGWPLYPVLKVLDFLRRVFYERISAGSFMGKWLPFVRNGKKRHLPPIAPVPFYRWFKKQLKSAPVKRRIVFFPGCVINFSDTEIGKSTVDVLRHYGIETILPPAQLCCGIPLISMGETETAKKLALKNIEMLENLEVEAMITACASCAYTFKKEYPKLLGDDHEKTGRFGEKVWDIHEYLEQRVNYKEGLGVLSRLVTFHDPCHLKRGLGISEPPRNILQAIPGIQFKEMADADRCCGFGGIFSLKHYDLSMKVAEEKVTRIDESGAEMVATGCPGCSSHIGDALSQAGKRIEVKHTVQILAESIRNIKMKGV